MSSNFEFIKKIQRFVRTENGCRRDSVATKSVSSQFSAQLTTPRARINKTVPHYVRCSKHKDKLAPDYFEPKNVVEQLRCGGVVPALALLDTQRATHTRSFWLVIIFMTTPGTTARRAQSSRPEIIQLRKPT